MQKVASKNRASNQSELVVENRRAKIIDAAIRQIATGGVDSVTFRQVAKLASVPLGSTTYYFKSRHHLLQEAFKTHLSNSTSRYSELRKKFDHTSKTQIIDFIVELARSEIDDGTIILVDHELFLFAARDPEVSDKFRGWQQIVLSQIAATLENVGVPHPFDAAHALLHLVRGFELDQMTGQAPDLARLRKRLSRNLIGDQA